VSKNTISFTLAHNVIRLTEMKFSQPLIYKNSFWVQRVAKDEGSRVLINPTALLGAYEIDKIEKFLQPLTYKKTAT